jgi:serine/threonine protein kinase
MELCNGTLTDLVRRAQAERNLPGLPPVDTVALGMMLVDAITAVHRRACSAHLDIKPDNVLLAAPKAGAAADALRSVRLSDFGLSKRLPSCVMTSVVTKAAPSVIGGAGGGTAGYAPPATCTPWAPRCSSPPPATTPLATTPRTSRSSSRCSAVRPHATDAKCVHACMCSHLAGHRVRSSFVLNWCLCSCMAMPAILSCCVCTHACARYA